MSKLKITDSRRAALTDTRSLATDKDGNEVLVGLTLEETLFYLNYGEQRLSQRSQNKRPDKDDRRRYLALHEKHEIQRLQVLGADIELRNEKPTRH